MHITLETQGGVTGMWKKLSMVKKATILGVATFVAVAVGSVGLTTKAVVAVDCGGNAIMRCGTGTAADFIAKVKNGNGGSQNDLNNIYGSKYYNLPSSDYANFAKYAQTGYAYNNGKVYVGNRLVGTNAQSLGRYPKTYSHPIYIDGKTYHEQSATRWVSYSKTPVLVYFNAKGQVQTIVMKECGNPIRVTPSNPTYSCKMLNQTQLSRDTFQYSTSTTATNGASINKVVYTFSDGTSITKTNPAEKVTKKFTKAGTFTAKVTVYVNVPGGRVYTIAPAGSCVKVATVKPAPAAACTYLKALATTDRTKFTLQAAASATNGATIQGYDFVVKNSAGTTVANPKVNTTAATASTSVTLASAGTYLASVSVRTSLGVKSGTQCVTKITVAEQPAAACVELKSLATSDRTKFTLQATASAANGATIQGYDFVVKNSAGNTVANPTVNTTATTANTGVTLASAGTYTASVTVRTSVGPKTGTQCTTTIKVAEQPVAACVELKALATSDRTKFTLQATASAANGATIQGYDFVVKNSAGNTVVSTPVNSSATTANTDVTLTNAGVYTASVTVRTSVGPKTGPQCTTTVKVEQPKTPGVMIEKKVDGVEVKQVAVNQNFVYQVVVKNTGQVDLRNAVVRDPAPQGVQMLSVDKGTITNNVWTYTIPELKVGESASFNITAKVTVQVEGNIVNTACVNAVEVNPNEPTKDDDCDTATVYVPPVVPKNPNINITKTVDGVEMKQVAVNAPFVYQVVVKNTGEVDMKNVVVTDNAPDGVLLTAADKGTVSADGLSWTYTIPELKVGESVQFNLTGKVTEYIEGALVNTACVNAPEVNPDEPEKDDACDTATVTVTPPVTPPETPETPSTPEVLPVTGAGSVLSIAAITMVGAALAHRTFLRRKVTQE